MAYATRSVICTDALRSTVILSGSLRTAKEKVCTDTCGK